MLTVKLKYCFSCFLLLSFFVLQAQESNNQSVVTIIGDEPDEPENAENFLNTNPYNQSSDPPVNQTIVNDDQKVAAAPLEKGVHIRFEVNYTHPAERLSANSYAGTAYNGNSYMDYEDSVKRKNVTLAERRFNMKKRFRKWFPARKKKYRPTLCGRF
jgi:hypothetical protein